MNMNKIGSDLDIALLLKRLLNCSLLENFTIHILLPKSIWYEYEHLHYKKLQYLMNQFPNS